MKKLLTILGSIGLMTTTGAIVISCTGGINNTQKINKTNINNISIPNKTINILNMQSVEMSIQTAIDNVILGTKKDRDYTILGNTTKIGIITVSAKDESKLISGSFAFNLIPTTLNRILTNTQLGVLENIKKETILKAVIEKNPNVKGLVSIYSIEDSNSPSFSAIISSNVDEFSNVVTVYFSIKKSS